MANVFDYLKERGNIPLGADPLHEVDNLILSELTYTYLHGIVPDDASGIPLRDACRSYFSLHKPEEVRAYKSFWAKAPFLMEGMLSGARFADTKLCWYVDEVDQKSDTQMSSLTYQLPDGSVYVAFRGTDGSVVGWKEDFMLCYLSETGGQARAARHLNRIARTVTGPLTVGGHSKGGNLAVYAAAFCDPAVQGRIQAVYTNDGPGFRPEVLSSAEYQRVLPRIRSIIPDTAIIGLLLASKARHRVVRSSAAGLYQHDGFSWMVEGNRFVSASLTAVGGLIDSALGDWLAQMDDDTRRSFVDTVFGLLEAPGMDTFSEMSRNKWQTFEAMFTALRSLPKEKSMEALRLLGQLSQSGGQAVASRMIAKLNQFLSEPDTGKGV